MVVAITPFNFPLNLVCHKVGPALAAGNAVIVKPASDTPLSALKLVEILLEAGLPPLAIACLTGAAASWATRCARDPRVRKISFTGSRDVGEQICKMAGIKRVTMELGSNSPLIVMPDADLDKVAEADGGHRLRQRRAGLHLDAAGDRARQRLRRSARRAAAARGRPSRPAIRSTEGTKMGPMIRERDAVRVSQWIDEAVRRRRQAA